MNHTDFINESAILYEADFVLLRIFSAMNVDFKSHCHSRSLPLLHNSPFSFPPVSLVPN